MPPLYAGFCSSPCDKHCFCSMKESPPTKAGIQTIADEGNSYPRIIPSLLIGTASSGSFSCQYFKQF